MGGRVFSEDSAWHLTVTRSFLLLIDYHLAGSSSMNGIEVFDALHRGSEAPISTIMLSADAPHHDLDICRIPLVTKSHDLDAVVEKVLAVLSFGENNACALATRKITRSVVSIMYQ